MIRVKGRIVIDVFQNKEKITPNPTYKICFQVVTRNTYFLLCLTCFFPIIFNKNKGSHKDKI